MKKIRMRFLRDFLLFGVVSLISVSCANGSWLDGVWKGFANGNKSVTLKFSGNTFDISSNGTQIAMGTFQYQKTGTQDYNHYGTPANAEIGNINFGNDTTCTSTYIQLNGAGRLTLSNCSTGSIGMSSFTGEKVSSGNTGGTGGTGGTTSYSLVGTWKSASSSAGSATYYLKSSTFTLKNVTSGTTAYTKGTYTVSKSTNSTGTINFKGTHVKASTTGNKWMPALNSYSQKYEFLSANKLKLDGSTFTR